MMSPTSIQRARDLAISREQEKEQLVRDRELRAKNGPRRGLGSKRKCSRGVRTSSALCSAEDSSC
jgi:hypothetical protein